MNSSNHFIHEFNNQTENIFNNITTVLGEDTDASFQKTITLEGRNGTGIQISSMDVAYVTATLTVSLLSVLGCLVILFVHWSCPDLRTSGRTMLVHLTGADLLTALGNLFGVTWYLTADSLQYAMAYCIFHSALTIMSSIASFLWTVVIAWYVFWILMSMKLSFSQRKHGYSRIISLACWCVPAAIAATAVGLNVLGYDRSLSQASWCWINPENKHALMWMFVTGKAWEIGTCISTFCLYGAVKILLSQQAKKRSTLTSRADRRVEKANIKLSFVPLVFFVIRIWGTLRFLIGCYAHEYASSSAADWITVLQGAGDSAQGFANFIMYIFTTKKVRDRLLHNCFTAKVFVGSAPEAKNANVFVSSAPEVKNANVFVSSAPEVKNANVFVSSAPEVKNANVFVGSAPEVKNANVFVGSAPEAKNANVFVGSAPEVKNSSSDIVNQCPKLQTISQACDHQI